MGKTLVRVLRISWDDAFYADMQMGTGFLISEPSGVSIDGVKEKSMYGAQSPLFGTTYEDEKAFIERYQCRCGRLMGKMFAGEKCENCNSVVEARPTNVKFTGWMSLGLYRIISPYYFHKLQNAIGKKVFENIVFPKYRVTTDGQRSLLSPDDSEYEPLSPYAFIGVDGFYKQYDEIIRYFRAKKKNKSKTFRKLLKEKRLVFTSHIPVFTTKLRPQSVTSDTFYYGGIDKLINTIYTLSDRLSSGDVIEEDYILQRIQVKTCQMWDLVLDQIKGKDGMIRDQVLGGSLNFTSRNVICPDPSLKDNEVDFSYNTFLVMFKYEILNYLITHDKCTPTKAVEQWEEASFRFSEKIYNVMRIILMRDNFRVLINRNPTLNYYSLLSMKIRNIKPDINDYTLSVPLSILPGLNADFDGDILNIIGLMNESMVYMYRKYDPVMRMIISRDTGNLNEYFSIEKGQLADLYAFAVKEDDPGCETPEMFLGPDGEYHTQEELDSWNDRPSA